MKLIEFTNAAEGMGNKKVLVNPEHVSVAPEEEGETRLYIRDGITDPEASGPWTVKETYAQVKAKFLEAGVEIL